MKAYTFFLFIATLAIASIPVLGYELTFNNLTDRTLIIMSKKRAGISERYYQIVGPGKSVTQAWHDANCLESLQWAELNPQLPQRGGLNFVNANQGNQIPKDKQQAFDEAFFSKRSGKGLYLWNYLKIVMVPNEVFQATKESARKLVAGFDKTVCQSIEQVKLAIKDKLFAGMLTQLKNYAKAKVKDMLKMTELQQKIDDYLSKHSSASTNKKECFFNLAKIAEAAGNIHGISICRNKEFVIFESGDVDDLTKMPLLIAETVEGQ